MASYNPKHVFDFEGILNMDIDPAHWKKVKKQLEEEFGQLKIAIQDGLAEEEAQKYIDQFNKIFRKAKLPEIGLDDLREGFAKLEVNVEKAVAAINNINLDALDDVIHELKLINGEVEKISKNKGGIKLFDDDFKKVMTDIERIAQAVAKTTNPLVRSIDQIDKAIARAKLSAADVQEALNYEVKKGEHGIKKSAETDARQFAENYKKAAKDPNATWEERYYWLVKFNKAYDVFLNKQKNPEIVADMEKKYGELYREKRGGDADRRNMLQNIINRGQGKDLVGYAKEPYALESTLKEIKSILQGGLTINGDKSKKGASSSVTPDVSIDLNGLEEVLSRITYKVQMNVDVGRIATEYLESILGPYDAAANEAFESLDGSKLQSKLDVLLQDAFAKVRDVLADGFDELDVEKAFKEYEEDGATDLPKLRAYLKKVIDPNLIAARQNKSSGQIPAAPVNLEGANITVDNRDVIAEIQKAEQSLGALVAQDDTLKSLKDSIAHIQVTPDNSEILGALKTLAQNVLNLAQEDTLQAIKNENVNLTRDDITQAVTEGVYARGFSTKYRDVDFLDVFERINENELRDKIFQNVVSEEEARERFNNFKNQYVVPANKLPGDVDWLDIQNRNDALQAFAHDLETAQANEKNNWAQVIVDAITDQTGKIIEVVKLLLPPEIAGGIDETKLVDAFNVLTTAIQDFGSTARYFFDELASGGLTVDFKLQDALETLGLLTDGKPSFKKPPTGSINTGMAIAKELVISTQPNNGYGVRDIEKLVEKQNKVYEAGGAVPRIISGFEQDGVVYQLQARAPGVNHRKGGSGMFDATDEQIDRLIYTFEQLIKEGLFPELHGDNIMYDRDKGFTVIDLSLRDAFGEGLTDPKNVIKTFLRSAGYGDDAYDADTGEFEQRVWDRFYMDPKDRLVNANTVAAEKAREQAAAQAAAQQKNAQEIKVTTDNSDVVSAIKELGNNLGSKVAQEDTLQAIKNAGLGLTKEDIALAVKEGVHAKEFNAKYRYMGFDEMFTQWNEHEYFNKLTGETFDLDEALASYRKHRDYYVMPADISPTKTGSADAVYIQDALDSIIKDSSPAQNDWVQTIVQAIKDNTNNLTKEDIVSIVKESTSSLTKEDITAAIRESVAYEEVEETGAPWALETTLNTTIKNILEKIQSNTAKLNGIEIKHAVEENTQATKQAAGDVSGKIENASAYPDLDKVVRKQDMVKNADGKLVPKTTEETQVRSELTDEAFRTVKDHFEFNDEGKPQLIFREVIDDLNKLRKANKQDENARAKAQKKVNEFLAKFESKTGGTAKFIPGFSELKTEAASDNFITNKGDIDKAYNRMLDLQKEYAKLETNFRKGQSSLNPFVNAINKAQNIENTFGAVEIRFNGLVEKSEELTTQFGKLRTLSGEIKTLTERMNTDPDFSVDDFQKLSVLMGEFTTTKNQVDGLLKNEAKVNKAIVADQKARIKEWVRLSKQLGVLEAKINSGLFDDTVVEQAKQEYDLILKKIDAVVANINDPSEHLVTVGDANIASENKTINNEMSKRIGVLAGQYEQLGRMQARAEQAGAVTDREKYEQLKKEVAAETEALRLNEEKNEGILNALQLHQENAYVSEKDLSIAKDRNKLYNEWLELVKEISSLDAKIDSGLFDEVTVENAKAAREAVSKQIDAIMPQLDLTREDYIFAGQESMKSEQSTILAQRQKLFKSLAGDYEKLGKAQGKLDAQQTEAASKKVEQLLKEIEKKKDLLNLTKDELSVLEDIGNQARENSEEMSNAKIRDKELKAELNAQKKLSRRQALVGKAGSAIGRADGVWLEAKSLEDTLPKEFLDRVTAYEKKVDNLKIKHNELSNSQGPVTKKQREQLLEQTTQVSRLTDELGGLLDEYQRLSGDNAQEMRATSLGDDDGLDAYKKELTDAVMFMTDGKAKIKSFNNETKTLSYTVKTGAHEFTEYTAAVRQLDHQLVSVKGTTKRTETFFEATKRKMAEISSYISGMTMISRTVQEMKKGIQYVREIDLALTELKKVTDETEEEYDQFLKTAAKTGDRLGTTISAVTEATATFSKLGYAMEQATEMAEAAIVYKNVGDNIESTGDAANSIISTMKGFGMEASEAMAIVDRFNEVGNRFAITSQGIGEALRLSASALNEGANSLDESIALITAANEVVNDPSSVGTALKTLTLRLRGSKTELQEMGEDVSDMAITTSQLQAKLLALTGGQVDIMLDDSTFKSTTQILREMAGAWDTMSDIQQAQALELMGGKRQANILSALIQNFDTVEDVIETSANSAGSALRENERYLDSIQGKVDQFNNATQAMWSNALDSDVVKGFVSLGTELVKIIDNFGVLKTLIFAIGTYLVKTKFNGNLLEGLFGGNYSPDQTAKEMKKVLEDLTKARDDAAAEVAKDQNNKAKQKKLKTAQSDLDAYAKAVEEPLKKYEANLKQTEALQTKLNDAQLKLEKSKQKLANYQANGNKNGVKNENTIKAYTNEVKRAQAEVDLLTGEVKQAQTQLEATGNTGLTAMQKIKSGISAATKAVGSFALQMAASMATAYAMAAAFELISKAGEKVWKFIDDKVLGESVEELQERFENLNGELTDVEDEIANLTDELNTTNDALAELLAKDKLSFAEQEELERLQSQSAELERQVKLAKELRDNLQMSVNEAAVNATGKYLNETSFASESSKSERVEETGSTGQAIGAVAGYAAGTAIGAAAGAKFGATVGSFAGPIGTAVGLAAGAIIGKVVGEKIGGKKYDEEKTVEEAIDSMSTDRADLKKKRDDAYEAYTKDPTNEELKKSWNEASANLATYDQNMATHVAQIQEAYNAIEITDDTDASTRAYKQQLGDIIDKYNMTMGGDGAKEVAINRVFDDGGFDAEKAQIDLYVKALEDGDKEAAKSIANLINQNEALKAAFSAKNLDPQDAIDYFTQIGEAARFNTEEGKKEEIVVAKELFDGLLKDFQSGKVDVDDLFDEEGKIIQTKLAEMFEGTSPETRAAITSLLEDSYNQLEQGLTDSKIDNLMARFGLKMSSSLLSVQQKALADRNIELFPNLKDEIDGIIDSFSELTTALGGVVEAMDLLEQARAEEAYSGSISLETMLKLMEQTDDYTKILEVDEYGAIKLVQNAEDLLINQRIEKIKIDAQSAYQTAEQAYQDALLAEADAKLQEQEAEHAYQTVTMTGPSQKWYTGILAELSGWVAYVQSLWNDIISGKWSGSLDRAKSAYNTAKSNYTTTDNSKEVAAAATALATARENSKTTSQNVETLEQERDEAKDKYEIASKITADNIKQSVNADDASGGNSSVDDVRNQEFQQEMEYWENRIAANQAKYEQIQNEIDLLEKKGQKANAAYYQEQITLEGERLALLEDQRAAAEKFITGYTNEQGVWIEGFEEGTEEWWEWANAVNNIESEIDSVTSSIVDLQDAIGEIDAYKFEEFNTRLDNLASKLSSLRDLIAPNGEEDWFDDEGNWTEKGVAVVGSYLQELETYRQGLEETSDAIANFNSIGNGADWSELTDEQKAAYANQFGIHSEQEYYDKQEELINQQYDHMSAIKDTEQSIIDMYESSIDAAEEYVSTLIEGYNEYIDSVKEALDAERDLYDFKKNVQKQSKDIADLERRIASLSGSTNKSDIVERRRLEAQLYESREALNDTYYEHSKESQQDALDAEATAYEESLNGMIENMRASFEQASSNTETFLNGVAIMTSLNAGAILTEYQNAGVELDPALTAPWISASAKVTEYSDDALGLMNQWMQNGFLTTFPSTVENELTSPWDAGVSAVDSFEEAVGEAMQSVVEDVSSNVQAAAGALSDLYKQIEDTEKRAKNVDLAPENTTPPPAADPAPTTPEPTVKLTSAGANGVSLTIQSSDIDALTETVNGVKYVKGPDGYYYKLDRLLKSGNTWTIIPGTPRWMKASSGTYGNGRNGGGASNRLVNAVYAKGTLGTKRDEWALTDEPQFGDELVLIPGKDGNLSFMRKGTGVIPADITANLMEWGQITPDSMQLGGGTNINMINNSVLKPQFDFTFDSLVHVDHCDQSTIKDLEKMVDSKIDKFSKDLNYSIKRFAR